MRSKLRAGASFQLVVRALLASALLGCSAESVDPAAASEAHCSWEVEYSRHLPVDDPPRPSRMGGVVLAGEDVVRVTFARGVGADGTLEGFDAAEIELSPLGSAKLAELYADAWDGDLPVAGRAVLRVVGARGALEQLRIIAGHPAPIRILKSQGSAILRMPVIEGRLARIPETSKPDWCVSEG